MLALHRKHCWLIGSLVLALTSIGCSTAPKPAPIASAPPVAHAAPVAAAPPAIASHISPAGYAAPRMPVVAYHPVPADPGLQRVSPRRYPIAVAPMRTYGCCH